LKAVEVAVRELNAGGGLMGIPVELAVGDDRCDAGMAVSVARRHVEQNKINFVIGPICPAVAIDATAIYAKAKVIQFVPMVTTVEFTRRNFDNIFRISANDEQEAQALAAYLAREQSGKKLAVVYGDVFYRRAMAEMVKTALPAGVRTSARFEPLQEVPGAYDRLVEKLHQDPPDIIYMALGGAQVEEFVGKLRKRGVKSLLIGGQHLLSQSFWQAAGATAEGIYVIAPIGSLTSPEYRSAVDLLQQAGIVPDLVALYSYVAVQTWAEAVRQAGGGEFKGVGDALRSREFTTALGRVAFDQKGDRRDVGYSIVTWQKGLLRELRMVAQVPAAPSQAAAPGPTGTQPTANPPEELLRFDQPVPFGPPPVYGNTIKNLADSIPLFPPIEGQHEALWKKNCSSCHKWDRQTLCQQGANYLANPGNVLRQQHPFGGPFKVALMRWSKGSCL
jgi:branched-chain amino acid transport system substrate-binding protein